MRIKREVRLINGVEKLKCSKCNYWLPFDEYSNDSKTSTGKRAYCTNVVKNNITAVEEKENITAA